MPISGLPPEEAHQIQFLPGEEYPFGFSAEMAASGSGEEDRLVQTETLDDGTGSERDVCPDRLSVIVGAWTRQSVRSGRPSASPALRTLA